jgi:membrane protease YdiL (CAAX protease family)
MNASTIRKNIRSIALTVAFSSIGFVLIFILKKLLHIDLSKLEMSVIAFVITSLSALLLFPKVFKIPFGKVSVTEFIQRIGLKIPQKPYRFVLLGIIAALISLTGMLIGSILTGKYVFDRSTINLAHAIFSLTPGIWEEVFYRGILIIVLLQLTKSYKKAFFFQIIIFGLAHIKGFDFPSLIDAFSVALIAIAFTYLAYKTKSLIPGIIFHYLHDTFLFTVQLPDGEYVGFQENALFYAALWLSILAVVGVAKKLSENYHIVNEYDFYEEERTKAQSSKRPVSH